MNGPLWYLKRCDLFERLTPEQAERMNRRALVRKFKRGSFIYAPTEPGQSVLVLSTGRVKIKDVTPDGKETILAFIEEGEIFGELALVESEPRQEYAEAVMDSQVVVVPRSDLLQLLEARPDLALSVTKLIGLRRRRIETRLRNLLFLSSRERMVRILLELLESHGVPSGNHCDISLPLSHQDFAGLIGVSRETVTVVLGQLQQAGLISIRRCRITVLDRQKLNAERNGRLDSPAGNPLARQPLKEPHPL
jgi:CRP-like cAMP-binding protein